MREKPQSLAAPEAINVSWLMDSMRDQLSDGRNYRLFEYHRGFPLTTSGSSNPHTESDH